MPSRPLPPAELIRRVGWDIHSRSLAEVHEQRGRDQWEFTCSLLPADWTFAGKRVLDFGCGVGRMLRNGPERDPAGEYWGCDIDSRSIAWLSEHLSPPLHVFESPELPPTSLPDSHFDLIYAYSVFTHLSDSWSAWLLELHRLLKADGILVLTVFGPGCSEHMGIPIDGEHVGMNVFAPFTPWDDGGPLIFHSEWWLRAHWGRAFEITELRPGDPAGPPPLFGQSAVVMRKRLVTLSIEELERPEPDEPREFRALRANIASLSTELRWHTVYINSRSWRLTAPLRAVGRRLRGVLRPPARC
jgi:SAM-dependent methyltransferase